MGSIKMGKTILHLMPGYAPDFIKTKEDKKIIYKK